MVTVFICVSPYSSVCSGESASGKTETTKLLIRHVIHLCHSGAEGQAVENKIIQVHHHHHHHHHSHRLQVSPILEAFGNAKTLMNNNSSRFGKYTELKFSGSGAVLGAQVCWWS
jgi:myosin heavy subunit